MSIDNRLFGFMPGKGTTHAIFIMRHVQRNTKQRRSSRSMLLWFREGIPREVGRCDLMKLGVDEWLIRTVMTLRETL